MQPSPCIAHQGYTPTNQEQAPLCMAAPNMRHGGVSSPFSATHNFSNEHRPSKAYAVSKTEPNKHEYERVPQRQQMDPSSHLEAPQARGSQRSCKCSFNVPQIISTNTQAAAGERHRQHTQRVQHTAQWNATQRRATHACTSLIQTHTHHRKPQIHADSWPCDRGPHTNTTRTQTPTAALKQQRASFTPTYKPRQHACTLDTTQRSTPHPPTSTKTAPVSKRPTKLHTHAHSPTK